MMADLMGHNVIVVNSSRYFNKYVGPLFKIKIVLDITSINHECSRLTSWAAAQRVRVF